MLIRIRTIDNHGFPEFRMDGQPIVENGDGVRLQNWTRNIFNNFRTAFKLHSDATKAVRTKQPGASGMQFGDLVHKMLGVPKCDTCERLQMLQCAVDKIIPLLPADNEDVRELIKVLKIR